MKPLRIRLQAVARQMQASPLVIEKDYVLSYLLAGLTAQPALRETLVFKGGTALKKLYFGDYRFSEDLDFSTIHAPRAEALETAIQEAVRESRQLLAAHGPFEIVVTRYLERDPHPGGQEAFVARVKFPWQPSPLCRIKLEIMHDEPVMLPPVQRSLIPLIHGYEETLVSSIGCYSLAEIVTEKMRALLQTQQKLLARGWNRPRARDYYDLWRILREYGAELAGENLDELLARKSRHRSVVYARQADFFTPELEAEAQRHWQGNLAAFVRDLPPCAQVLAELKAFVPRFFPALPE